MLDITPALLKTLGIAVVALGPNLSRVIDDLPAKTYEYATGVLIEAISLPDGRKLYLFDATRAEDVFGEEFFFTMDNAVFRLAGRHGARKREIDRHFR